MLKRVYEGWVVAAGPVDSLQDRSKYPSNIQWCREEEGESESERWMCVGGPEFTCDALQRYVMHACTHIVMALTPAFEPGEIESVVVTFFRGSGITWRVGVTFPHDMRASIWLNPDLTCTHIIVSSDHVGLRMEMEGGRPVCRCTRQEGEQQQAHHIELMNKVWHALDEGTYT